MKTRRSWMLAVAMLSLTAGGVWAGVAYANARTTKAGDCCLDPTCPPGCSPDCPPNCLDGDKVKADAKKTEDVKAEPTTCSGGKCEGGKCGTTTKTYCP